MRSTTPVSAPTILSNTDSCVDAIIAKVGKDIRIGMPLGLGKPAELINALYQRAKADPTLSLTMLTALSLEKPAPNNPVEAKFMESITARVFDKVPDLDYTVDQRQQCLPPNVSIREFFFKPGSRLNNKQAQQDYISTNYTFAARDVFEQGCNVAAQMVCKQGEGESLRYSLSCNPDTGPELVELMRRAERDGERQVAIVAQVNQNLPYMGHDAEVSPAMFDFVIDHPRYHSNLFSTPKMPVTTPDYAIGLYASALVKDGGTLQIGIGALGDAIVYAMQQRHNQPDNYQAVLGELGGLEPHKDLITRFGGLAPFEKGIYGATEMFVDGFYHLLKSGILKREVYDFWALQQLINEGKCNPSQLEPNVLLALETLGLRVIRTKDFDILKHHGFFNENTRYDQGYIIAPDGTKVIANVADPTARAVMGAQCLGKALKNGIVLHGGFFLGPRDFYDGLRNLSNQERNSICMAGVYKINQLDLNPRLYKTQRIHARFINTGIMVTLNGGVMSDGLSDGRVVSGVGGQYNFVAMAHQLPTGRSILMIRAVRDKDGTTGASSNIVFNYGHLTIPRHLRDIVITEYGIADLRSKTDRDIAKALINIADSRFQARLLEQAKQSGKIEANYTIPQAFRNNTPAALEAKLSAHRQAGYYPAFPFGTDLTAEDQRLAKALKAVKARAAKENKLTLALKALLANQPSKTAMPYLERMGLTSPQGIQEKVLRMLIATEIDKLP